MRVTRRAEQLRARGVPVISFGAGEPDFDSPRSAVEAAREALAAGLTKYTPVAGSPDLRQALADSYRERWRAPWQSSQVLVTSGAKMALFELAVVLFEEGQEVVLPAPCWVSFTEQIRLMGAEPRLVPCRADDGFAIKAEPILAALSPRTRAVLLNSPCNPTGGVVEGAELRQIVAACAARDVLVIADETYDRFYYDGRRHASIAGLASEFPDTVALVGSFSKTYAMTGWRVGYLLGPAPIISAAITVQGHATSNVTSFAMPGALAALHAAESEVEAMLVEYQARRDLMVAGLNALPGVECTAPGASFYAFPRVSAHFTSGGSGAFAERLLERAQVAVVPGAAFGDDEHVRVSFACSQAQIREGLSRLARALSAG